MKKFRKYIFIFILVIISFYLYKGCRKNDDVKEKKEVVFNFEESVDEWRGGISGTTRLVEEESYTGRYSLKISGRSQTYDSIIRSMEDVLEKGKRYKISLWLKYNDGPENKVFSIKAQNLINNEQKYETISDKKVNKGEWTLIEGDYTIPKSDELSEYSFYIETTYKEVPENNPQSEDYDLMNFYVDDIEIIEVESMELEEDIPSLYSSLGKSFNLGTTVIERNLFYEETFLELIKKHFNSITIENDMGMMVVQPEEGKYNWDISDKIINFANDNNLNVNGHVLVSHTKVPGWFFLSKEEPTEYATSEAVLERLKEYIYAVVGRYKGSVYSWDVANLVVADSDSSQDELRRDDEGSTWATIIGDVDGDGYDSDYIELAFQYAHEADPEAKLIISDYNISINEKKVNKMYDLVERMLKKGIPIDGIGMEVHISIHEKNIAGIEKTIEKFNELKKYNPNFTVSITQLDVSMYRYNEAEKEITEEMLLKQANVYKELFNIVKGQAEKGNIDTVTFWGIADSESWLNDKAEVPRKDAPLLFDRDLNAKPAFWSILEQ